MLSHGQLKRWTGHSFATYHALSRSQKQRYSILIIKTATFIVHTRVKIRKLPESLSLSAYIFRKVLRALLWPSVTRNLFFETCIFRNTDITGTSVSGKTQIEADRASDSGDFLFFTLVCTMNVAVFKIKIPNLYFCEWPSG